MQSAFGVAEEIRRALSKKAIPIEENELYVTLSGGLSKLIVIDNKISIDDTMKKTDVALYQAKDQGRNQIVTA